MMVADDNDDDDDEDGDADADAVLTMPTGDDFEWQ